MVVEQPSRVSDPLSVVDTTQEGDQPKRPPLPSKRRSRGTSRRRDGLALALLLGMFSAGAPIEADASGARLFGVEGPECPSRLVLPDHGCPGCGLTRATTMPFAAARGISMGTPLHLGIGLSPGWLRDRRGSRWPGILLHFAYNGTFVLTAAP